MNAIATPLSPSESLGAIIRRSRVARELTIRDVADRCGVKASEVRAWEVGELVPTPRAWARLCNLVHRGLRGSTALYQAARAQVGTHADAIADVARAREIDAETAEAPDMPPDNVVAAVPSIADAPSLGEAIRRARLIEGMTQDEFGALFDCSGQAVSQWELNGACPVREHFDKLVSLVPELDRWREDVRDIPKPSPGPKPEGFTTSGGTPRIGEPAGPRVLPMIVPPLPPAPDPEPTIEQLGVEHARAMVDVIRAREELRLFMLQGAHLERAARAAEERFSEATKKGFV